MPKIMLTNPESPMHPADEVVADWLVRVIAASEPLTEVSRIGWGKLSVTPEGGGRSFVVSVEEV